MNKIILLHGPNLNLLGTREPDIYGSLTQEDLRARLEADLKLKVELFQSNHEGVLIDFLQDLKAGEQLGVVFNPAAFTHYSYALYDCIRAINVPVVEVHLSDISSREDFRAHSVIAPAALAQFSGKGYESYKSAAHFLIERTLDVRS